MNRRDGMRRLALLSGIIGALACCQYSLHKLDSIVHYYKFRSLVESDFVRKEAASYIADVQSERTAFLDEEHSVESQIAMLRGDDSREDVTRRSHLASHAGILGWEASGKLSSIEKLHSEIDRNGIGGIQWTYGYAQNSIDPTFPWPRHLDILSIKTQDGQVLYPTAKPSILAFVLLALVPILGFVVPWVAVRGVEWVFVGFSRSPGP